MSKGTKKVVDNVKHSVEDIKGKILEAKSKKKAEVEDSSEETKE